nr:mitochondrial distribution and morphology protein 12 [Quercus suber]
MSVDIDWKTLTEGPDGDALAETIRDFIHERFQHVPFPKLIRSVAVHSFEFGSVAPQIVLKDIGDPLPDFYESEDADSASSNDEPVKTEATAGRSRETDRDGKSGVALAGASHKDLPFRTGSPPLPRGATPGFLGPTPNMGYFHLPLGAGLSGTQTPLAAVAGAHFQQSNVQPQHHHAESFSSVTPPTTATPPSRPISRDQSYFDQRHGSAISDGPDDATPPAPHHERSPEDLQVVFHVTYTGDVRLSLTADVFLDYPMPSFVGIPLKLSITGLTFDGVGIVAYIKKRAHLCFLAPEDAEALVGGDNVLDSPSGKHNMHESASTHRVGALLEDIKIETEMGETDSSKPVLKNVGKIEKFVLEQAFRSRWRERSSTPATLNKSPVPPNGAQMIAQTLFVQRPCSIMRPTAEPLARENWVPRPAKMISAADPKCDLQPSIAEYDRSSLCENAVKASQPAGVTRVQGEEPRGRQRGCTTSHAVDLRPGVSLSP